MLCSVHSFSDDILINSMNNGNPKVNPNDTWVECKNAQIDTCLSLKVTDNKSKRPVKVSTGAGLRPTGP